MAQTLRRVFPDGDYPQQLNDLWAAIEAAEKAERNGPPADLLAGELSPFETLVEEYNTLKAEAEADAAEKRRVVVLRAVGRGKWRKLKQQHPMRVQSETVDEATAKGDRLAGVNADTVGDDLLHASIETPTSLACAGDMRLKGQACSPDNPCATRGAFDQWADEVLSEGEFTILERDAWSLVNGAQFDPKPPPSSPTRSSDTN